MADTKKQTIKLQSSDGEHFEVETDVIKLSKTIDTMLQDLGPDENSDADPIPLQNVDAAILKKVIEYCTHHKDDLPPLVVEGEDERAAISAWDYDFLKAVDQDTLIELLLAANYLDIEGLMDVTCKTVANFLKTQPNAEIRRIFNIENDFTPEEEEQVQRETGWLLDELVQKMDINCNKRRKL